jgi:hypothetical protein
VVVEQCYFSSCCKFQEDLQLDQIILCMNLRSLQIACSRDLCSMCLHGWCVIEALAHHKVNNFKDCIVVVCFIEVVLNRLDFWFFNSNYHYLRKSSSMVFKFQPKMRFPPPQDVLKIACKCCVTFGMFP